MSLKSLILGVVPAAMMAGACWAAPVAPAASPAAPTGTTQRVWTAQGGQTIAAEFVELNQGIAILKGTNGAPIKVRLSSLSPVDQTLALELDAKRLRGPAAQEQGATSNVLPVFLEGPGAKCHAVYTHTNFVAKVLPGGSVSITCRDGAATVGKAITLGPGYGYTDTEKKRYVGRRITSFDTYPKPTLKPTVLTFTGTLDDEVKFSVSYEFKDNTVQTWGWVDDPAGIKYPTGYTLRFQFVASHAFELTTPVEEQRKVLAPFSVLVEPLTGELIRYPYSQSLQSMAAGKRLAVDGPIFGPRKLDVTSASVKDAPLAPWIYPGYAPYQGYSVGLQKREKEARSDRLRMILTVE